MAHPKKGTRYAYRADAALGLAARIADPDVDNNQHPEMAELDMPAGTLATVDGFDTDRQLVLLAWTDRAGTPRITSVSVETLNDVFAKES